MADIVLTPQYRLILRRWQDGRVTIREMELFVKTNWLTREQADMIYTYERKQTQLVIDDPLTSERIASIQDDIRNNRT